MIEFILLIVVLSLVFLDDFIKIKVYEQPKHILIGKEDTVKPTKPLFNIKKYLTFFCVVLLLSATGLIFQNNFDLTFDKKLNEVILIFSLLIFYTFFAIKTTLIKIPNRKTLAREIIYFFGNLFLLIFLLGINELVILPENRAKNNIYENYKENKIFINVDIAEIEMVDKTLLNHFSLRQFEGKIFKNKLKDKYPNVFKKKIDNSEGLFKNQSKPFFYAYVSNGNPTIYEYKTDNKLTPTTYVNNKWRPYVNKFDFMGRLEAKYISKQLYSKEIIGRKYIYNYYTLINDYPGYSYYRLNPNSPAKYNDQNLQMEDQVRPSDYYYFDPVRKKIIHQDDLQRYYFSYGGKKIRDRLLHTKKYYNKYDLYYSKWNMAEIFELPEYLSENEFNNFSNNNISKEIIKNSFKILDEKNKTFIIKSDDIENQMELSRKSIFWFLYTDELTILFIFMAYGYRLAVSILTYIFMLIQWSINTLTK